MGILSSTLLNRIMLTSNVQYFAGFPVSTLMLNLLSTELVAYKIIIIPPTLGGKINTTLPRGFFNICIRGTYIFKVSFLERLATLSEVPLYLQYCTHNSYALTGWPGSSSLLCSRSPSFFPSKSKKNII